MVARLAEDRSQVQVRIGFFNRLGSNSPEGKDERLARIANPLLGEIKRVIFPAIDLERRISDQQSCVAFFQHLFDMRLHGNELSSAAEPFFKKNFRERN